MTEFPGPHQSWVVEVLRRFVAGEADNDEITRLRSIAPGTDGFVAAGSGAIAIAGSVFGSNLTTNFIRLPDGATPEKALALMRSLGIAVVEVPAFSLPPRKPTFTGRTDELERLCAMLQPGAITALRGIGGIGKTELAVEAAHRLLPLYPDAVVFVDLLGKTTPKSARAAREEIIRHFEPTAKLPDDENELGRLYLGLLAAKRVLLLLDNAIDAAQVTPLLPPAPSAAIVTSRSTLSNADIRPLPLENLPQADAEALIVTIVGEARPLSQADLAAVAEACRCHPLALRVAATFLRDHRATPVGTYVARITERRDKLKLDGDPDSDVVAVLGLSVENLEKADPDLARRWRDLAIFPADFDFAAAAAFWGDEDADAGLERLELLETLGLVEASGDGRHRLHDLLRDVALLRSPPPEIETARLRHAQVYCAILGQADQFYLAGGAARTSEALALFDRERANILAGRAVAASRAAVDDEAAALVAAYAAAGADVTYLRIHPREWIAWWQDALGGYRKVGNRGGEGAALGNLGTAYADLGETKTAIEYHQQHLAIAREIGDRRGEGNALGNLGNAYADLGETKTAIEYHQQHLAIAREIGDRRGEGGALGNLGNACANLGETKTAIELYEQALVVAREIGDRRGEGNALGNLGIAYANLGETEKAIEYHQQNLIITREIGDRRGETATCGNLGIVYKNLGETEKAIEYHQQHLAIAREIGDRRGEGAALGNLGNAYKDLGETETAIEHYEQARTIAREIGDRRGEGAALGNLGNAHKDLGETETAIEHYEQARTIACEIDDRRGEGAALGNLGNAYASLGETETAIDCVRKALALFTAIDAAPQAAQVRVFLDGLEQRRR